MDVNDLERVITPLLEGTGLNPSDIVLTTRKSGFEETLWLTHGVIFPRYADYDIPKGVKIGYKIPNWRARAHKSNAPTRPDVISNSSDKAKIEKFIVRLTDAVKRRDTARERLLEAGRIRETNQAENIRKLVSIGILEAGEHGVEYHRNISVQGGKVNFEAKDITPKMAERLLAVLNSTTSNPA